MTYYYLASDQKLGSGCGTIGIAMSALELVSGFDYPIQVEILMVLKKSGSTGHCCNISKIILPLIRFARCK
ncbi:hypothetical protein FZC79_22530 [Rossellomorea vietnamensis]|uniref:Uncharacterized protein n=1 Tax=Rossellomorea vietnamensis TaxID=218284 RepID=A0A5D4K5B5_9BACI|nr:hypothetical protein [Rossellomorea vietnamensis]TYR72494.1 hypothetical protein FZC79_22530 [Rossellomorea vietnamensis]